MHLSELADCGCMRPSPPLKDQGQSIRSVAAKDVVSGKVRSYIGTRPGKVDVMEGETGVAALGPEMRSVRRLLPLFTCQLYLKYDWSRLVEPDGDNVTGVKRHGPVFQSPEVVSFVRITQSFRGSD